MADEKDTAAEPMAEEAPKKRRSRQPRKPDYENDDGVKARKRAANRSDNRGKKVEEPVAPEPEVSDEMPQIEAAAGAEPEALIPEEAPAPAEGEEGGIVAEAQAELDAANAEEVAEGGEGTPAEEAAEGETVPEAPEAPSEAPIEEAPAPEEPMPMAAMQEERVGDYVPPEGASHDELIDQYHEALMFGDAETAKSLYKQLQNHRYMENGHRTKFEAQTAKDAQEYLDTANELAAKHPELGVDGIEADKVMALSDLYRANGKSAVEALRLAVADLYPDEAAAPGIAEEPPAPEAPMAEAAAGIDTSTTYDDATDSVVEPAPEAPAPEEPKAEEAPAEEKPPLIPDMTARNERKRNVVTLPNASARNVPEPPPAPEDRTSALRRMKETRGQTG